MVKGVGVILKEHLSFSLLPEMKDRKSAMNPHKFVECGTCCSYWRVPPVRQLSLSNERKLTLSAETKEHIFFNTISWT